MTRVLCKSMIEIRDLIHRLRAGQSNRQIEREIGVDRSIVKKIKELSLIHQWLDLSAGMPSDEAIAKVWDSKLKIHKPHPLNLHRGSLEVSGESTHLGKN